MSEVYKVLKYRNKLLKIVVDSDTGSSPREWDNFGVMLCKHRHYNLGDYGKDIIKASNFDDIQEFREYLIKDCDAEILIPLYLYDHSGISMSCAKTGQYADYWDSGCVGFIYSTKKRRKEEKLSIKKATSILIDEVKTYSQYLEGDVYGFQLYKLSKCSHGDTHEDFIDSCYGYYGTDFEKNGLSENIPNWKKFKEVKI